MDTDLADFITHARSKGMDHATIRTILLAAGWKDREIARTLATEELDLSVPEPHGEVNARDAFLYVATFAALYTMIVSLTILFFHYLDWLLPDVAFEVWERQSILSSIRWSLATLTVSSPLFFYLTTLAVHDIRREPSKAHSPFRLWLTYFTLLIAATTLAGDLVALLYTFLNGELSLRFASKVAVLLAIAGTVFWYYLLTVRSSESDEFISHKARRSFAVVAVAMVAMALVSGFYLAGSPSTVRMRRMDERRVNDLRSIRNAIRRMVTRRQDDRVVLKRDLPETLEEAADFVRSEEHWQQLNTTDPQTGESYEYTIISKSEFELRATFLLPRERKQDMFWNHPSGAHTFRCDVLKDDG